MSLCYLLGPGLPLHLTGHMGLRRDAAKMPAVKNNKLFSYLIFFLIMSESDFPFYICIFLPARRLWDVPVLVFHFLVHPQDRPWTVLSSSFDLVWRALASQPNGTSHPLLFCLQQGSTAAGKKGRILLNRAAAAWVFKLREQHFWDFFGTFICDRTAKRQEMWKRDSGRHAAKGRRLDLKPGRCSKD